jgi:protease I
LAKYVQSLQNFKKTVLNFSFKRYFNYGIDFVSISIIGTKMYEIYTYFDSNNNTEVFMSNKLAGKKVAILSTDGFEQSELFKPKKALEDEGAMTQVVSPKSGEIKGWNDGNWGKSIAVDIRLEDAKAEDYNALVLPGGVINPDLLRTNETVLQFIRDFFEQGKPVAAICHASWSLINAEVVEGREMTSYHTVRKDLENAGAKWTDAAVVVDNGLITSRNPNDIPAFCEKLIEEIIEGKHERQSLSAAN